jgi:hypothetical protein
MKWQVVNTNITLFTTIIPERKQVNRGFLEYTETRSGMHSSTFPAPTAIAVS